MFQRLGRITRALRCTLNGAALFGLSACSGDFESPMLLSGYRVLGIEASSPELGPNDSLTLQTHDYYAGSDELSYQWQLCLNSWGPTDNYRCKTDWVDLSAELELEQSRPSFTLDLGPAGVNLQERLADLGDVIGPDGSERSLEQGFDVWLSCKSGPICRGCEPIRSEKRLHVHDGDVDTFNQNPVIEGFKVTGSRTRGATLRLEVNTDTPQTYRDPATGRRLKEEYLYSWYTSGGTTDPTRTFGSKKESELMLPERRQELEVVVTVRDGRGGFALSRQSLRIE